MVLYSYYRSSCSYRVRIALNLKQLEYSQRAVHLVKDGGEQHLAEYVKLNPMRVVPTLIDDDMEITQSMAIIEYLDEKYPSTKLFGDTLSQRTKTREICEIINSGIQPIQNLAVIAKLGREHGFGDDDKKAWVAHWIERGFQALEQTLSSTAGRFCLGDTITAADCFLVPQVYNARRYGVNMPSFPTIEKIDEGCLSLEAFGQARPESQPDAPQSVV